MDSLKQYIGIDPSFRKNGFAICIIGGGEASFKIFEGFLQFFDWLQSYKKANEADEWKDFKTDTFFCIENSNLQALSFDMRGNVSVACRKSRDVGKNQAISQCTVDICTLLFGKDKVLELSPLQKGAKVENDVIFRAIAKDAGIALTNYKGQVGEQDKRDAFMLALKIYK